MPHTPRTPIAARPFSRRSVLQSALVGMGAAATGLGVEVAPASAATGYGEPAGELYVPEVDGNTIAVVDTGTRTVVRRLPVGPVATRPAVLARNASGTKLYCDNFGLAPATISIVDRVQDAVRTLPVGSTPLGAFSSNDGREVFLPEVGFTVEVVSTETDRIVRRFRYPDIPVGSIMGPDGLLYIGFATGLIGAYDAQTGKVVKPPIFSGGVATFWYSFSADGRTLYTDTVNTIGAIDVETWRLRQTIPTSGRSYWLPTDPGAFTSTLSPDGTKVYVTLFGGTGVLVVDVATNKIIRKIPTAGVTTGITFSADGTRGYISDLGASTKALVTPVGELITFANLITAGVLGPGQLVVIDPRTDAVVGDPIPTRPGPGLSLWLPHL